MARKYGGAQIQEQLGPLGIEVDRLAQGPDGLVVALGSPVQEAELHAGVDRAGIRAEDALQLRPGLGILAPVHVRGGQEVARPHVGGVQGNGPAEGVAGPVPHLLLVVHDSELQPDSRVARGGLGELFDARLRIREAPQADQEVAQSLHEGGIVRVVAQGLLVDGDGLLDVAPRLVDVAERRPGAVVVGIELHGALEAGDGLVPGFGLDGQAPEQELGLGEIGLALGEATECGAGAIVGPLLNLIAREGQSSHPRRPD